MGVFARVGQNHTFIVIYGVRIFGGVIARVGQNHTFIVTYVGLARTIYIRCICGIFGREITKNTVIYGVCKRFWPTLDISYIIYLRLSLNAKGLLHKKLS